MQLTPIPEGFDGMIVETLDENGVVIERQLGHTQAELLAQHRAGTCWMFCGHCMEEASAWGGVDGESRSA